ncbi:hypothetical protein HC028_20980 [Planosporangium flavigriseum]|uniref:Uncharacterized protein n=1 Tax=Planosporangium flavigriseum TaxID=373681 RepID=A0A8J3LJV3_9ACTN|nr:hypothetical protein [Planosporangium flavigriseum]NJC66958.1 hypothetical protein [Planosporangium flavigriseum]GIG73977.1 hypothetical protein Pfl04_23810 [Planosporangium flavigriseum]
MSGEFATPVAVKRHRARPVPVRARINAAVAHLRSRLPSQEEALDALAQLRMPGTPDPDVRMRQLLGISAWSAVLGALGLIIAARVVFGIFTEMPLWYWFLIFAMGIPGVVATFTAFATLHKGRLPWKLMRFASAAEVLALVGTYFS